MSPSLPYCSAMDCKVDGQGISIPTFDLTPVVVMFAALIQVVSVATVLLFNHAPTQIPDDVIAEIVYNFIRDHDVQPLPQKRHCSNADDPHPTKKRK